MVYTVLSSMYGRVSPGVDHGREPLKREEDEVNACQLTPMLVAISPAVPPVDLRKSAGHP